MLISALLTALLLPMPVVAEQPTPGEVPHFADNYANHYKCYRVEPEKFQVPAAVFLIDQFKEMDARVFEPRYLCNPVDKNGTGIPAPELHYVCFGIEQDPVPLPRVMTRNQFGVQILQPYKAELLCLPSTKVHI